MYGFRFVNFGYDDPRQFQSAAEALGIAKKYCFEVAIFKIGEGTVATWSPIGGTHEFHRWMEA